MKLLNQKGFTLIEILIAIVIITLLIGTVVVSYRIFERRTELEDVAQKIFSTLKLAQTQTLASNDASQYGVHFENDQYILFKGDAYLAGAPDNKVYQLPGRLEIFQINLADGGNDIIFQRIVGSTAQFGTVRIRIISQPTETRAVTVQPYGQTILGTISGGGCCDTDRLEDTRHVHLDMGWSIQGSNILNLHFGGATATDVNINMADYFNGDQTEFDWSGTIEIDGQNQELRIHTHSLDIINTILCIHRDQDHNNESIMIIIDDQDIISYDNNGDIVIGAFGGIAEIQ